MNISMKQAAIAWMLFGANAAHAGREVLTDGTFDTFEHSNYASDGQFWHIPDFQATGFSTIGSLPLYVDLGNGPVQNLTFAMDAARGKVTFRDSSGNLTGSFFEPMHLTGANYNPNNRATYTYGEVAPEYLIDAPLPSGPFDYSKAHSAIRFTWPSQCPFSTGSCSSDDLLNFQAVMIELDAPGDFMLQFNYNNFNSLPLNATATGLFQIGSSTGSYAGPFTDTGPNYCFHSGALISCNAVTAAVPEPETVPLIALGALAAGAAALSRRRRRMAIT